MRLYNLYGKLVYKNVKPYLINWERKSKSHIQFRLKQLLYPYWKNHIVYEEFPVYGSKMKVDFVDLTNHIAIELSPLSHHNNYNPFFHKSRSGYLGSIKRDYNKYQWLVELNNFKFLELIEEDLDDFSPQYIWDKFGIDIL